MPNLYGLSRAIFFSMDAEKAHKLGLDSLKIISSLGLTRFLFGAAGHIASKQQVTRNVLGLSFPNAVGCAAGLDKNGEYITALSQAGFGAIEIGTITPRPQPGNPKPRLFRLPQAEGIINRMGFNNKGVDYLVEQVKQQVKPGQKEFVLGINIGKNFDTPVENALDDYLICLNKVYDYADYITINISSPNTPGLRKLQFGDELFELLSGLKARQIELDIQKTRYVPLLVKIAPDVSDEEIGLIAQTILATKIDGVIATNTTLSRAGVENLQHAQEAGGLSGKPLKEQATHVVKILVQALQNDDKKIPVIAAGGIMSADDAKEKLAAGASLVQIYSGFIYKGPQLISECAQIKNTLL